MKNYILIVALAFAMIIGVGNAETYTNGDYEYEIVQVSGSTYAEITGYNGTDSNLTIPASLDGYSVYEIGYGAFSGNTYIENVIISDGIQRIDFISFDKCSSLKTVNIPASVTSINSYAFRDCTMLEKFTVSSGSNSFKSYNGALYSYDMSVLYKCPQTATTISLPSSLVEIYSNAFSGCAFLTEINIPTTVTTLGERVFEDCTSLKSISLPNGITTIPLSTFYGCKSLEKVVIPDTVETIGSLAFTRCTSLTSIELPSGLKTIESYAFSNSGLETVELPESLEVIQFDAFTNTQLSSVFIPGNVKEIGDNAFRDCENLVRVEVEDGVQSIGDEAFGNCSSLEMMILPETVTTVGEYAIGYTIPYYSDPTIDTDTLIYGVEGSEAHNYALANGIAWLDENVQESEEILVKASYQAYLIEPWAMRMSVRFTDADGNTIDESSLQSYGAYAIRSGVLEDTANISVEDIVFNEEVTVVRMSEVEGQGIWAMNDGTGRSMFAFDDGLYTYRMSENVCWVAYCVDAEGVTHFSGIKQKSLHDIAESLVDLSSTDSFIKAILEDMLVLEKVTVDYRSDFSNLSDLEVSTPPTMKDCGIEFGQASTDGKYGFGNTYMLSLIEPWSLRLNVRIYDSTDSDTSSTDHVDYIKSDDYGLIVYQDKDGKYDNMSSYEELLKIEDAYVFNKYQGRMHIDMMDFVRVYATYSQEIYTYELDKTIYCVAFYEADGEYYYSKVLERNLLEYIENNLAAGNGSEKLLALYKAMVDMYESVKAYHETL